MGYVGATRPDCANYLFTKSGLPVALADWRSSARALAILDRPATGVSQIRGRDVRGFAVQVHDPGVGRAITEESVRHQLRHVDLKNNSAAGQVHGGVAATEYSPEQAP